MAAALIAIGGLLLVGLVVDWLARYVRLPRVTLLLVFGIAAGPVGLDVLPPQRETWYTVLATVALTMVGLLIGGDFTRDRLQSFGSTVAVVAVVNAVVVAACVAGALLLAGIDPVVALPLGGIAAAAAPATLLALSDEVDAGPRQPVVLGTAVSVDAISVILFSVLTAVAALQTGGGVVSVAAEAAREVGGAVVLGAVVGVPAALASGRLREGQPLLEEAVGVVLLRAGLSQWLDVSYLLAAVTAGAVIANVATHHQRTFRGIEGIEWPFLVLFFVLAGASLEVDALTGIGVIGVVYVAARAVGKLLGGVVGGVAAGFDRGSGGWLGVTLLPQAGVALGLALLAEERLPQVGGDITAAVVVTTVVFELVGPLVARRGLRQLSTT